MSRVVEGYIGEPGWDEALAQLPAHLQPGIERYLRHHIPFGSFLQAVVSNDLFAAVETMNPASFDHLRAVVGFFAMYAPATCHGSREAYAAWVKPPEPPRCKRCGCALDDQLVYHECER